MTIEENILSQGILEIVHPNMAQLNETDQAMFAMVRRSGFGASDSSIVLGINPWRDIEQLVKEKRSIGLTPEEIEVGNKETVRKGHDLEPLILEKFAKFSGLDVCKPEPMYRIAKHPQLTINFDGVIALADDILIPVEAKSVSIFGDKYWDKTKSIDNIAQGTQYSVYSRDIAEHVHAAADLYGIPSYYYTQVQQQMLGLDCTFAYMAVLFDRGWDFRVFKVFKDEYVQQTLITQSEIIYPRIKRES